MSSDQRHNPGEKWNTGGNVRLKQTYMDNINEWTGRSTAESFHMTLNRDSWRGSTWQAVQAANYPTV